VEKLTDRSEEEREGKTNKFRLPMFAKILQMSRSPSKASTSSSTERKMGFLSQSEKQKIERLLLKKEGSLKEDENGELKQPYNKIIRLEDMKVIGKELYQSWYIDSYLTIIKENLQQRRENLAKAPKIQNKACCFQILQNGSNQTNGTQDYDACIAYLVKELAESGDSMKSLIKKHSKHIQDSLTVQALIDFPTVMSYIPLFQKLLDNPRLLPFQVLAAMFIIIIDNNVDIDVAISFFTTYLNKANVPKNIKADDAIAVNVMRLPFSLIINNLKD
jgi:hypothetical protein